MPYQVVVCNNLYAFSCWRTTQDKDDIDSNQRGLVHYAAAVPPRMVSPIRTVKKALDAERTRKVLAAASIKIEKDFGNNPDRLARIRKVIEEARAELELAVKATSPHFSQGFEN